MYCIKTTLTKELKRSSCVVNNELEKKLGEDGLNKLAK